MSTAGVAAAVAVHRRLYLSTSMIATGPGKQRRKRKPRTARADRGDLFDAEPRGWCAREDLGDGPLPA